MSNTTLQLRCNVCDEVLVAHWFVDSVGVFALVDNCAKCAAQQERVPDVACTHPRQHWDGNEYTCPDCGEAL